MLQFRTVATILFALIATPTYAETNGVLRIGVLNDMPTVFEFAGFPLVRTRARFLKPTRYGDDVDVTSKIAFGTSSFDVEHRLSLKGETCVECSEKRVWVVRGTDGKLTSHPVPETVLSKFR